MSYEIHRARVPQYNSTNGLIQAQRDFVVSWPLLERASDYTAVIESAAIDLSTAPLDTKPDYEIMIFCDLKAPDTPPGLEYGPNFFKLPGPLQTVDQFTFWLEDTIFKKAAPRNLGLFQLNSDDRFTFSLQETDYNQNYVSGDFIVYFNEQMIPILEGFVDKDAPIQAGGQLFYPLIPRVGTTVSEVDTIYRLNKIESLLIYTTIPMTKINVLSNRDSYVTKESILGTIELNSMQYNLRSKSDWRYIPDVYRHYSLTSTDMLQSFSLWVVIAYVDGSTVVHTLKPRERFNVNVAFFPRLGVDKR